MSGDTSTRRATIAAAPRSLGVRALRGPSLWHAAPVALLEAELADAALGADDALRLSSRMIAALPSLASSADAFAARIAREPAPAVAAVLEAAMALQSLGGSARPAGVVMPAGDPDTWAVAVGYEEESVGLASLRFALELVEDCLADEPPDVEGMIAGLRRRLRRDRPGRDMAAVIAEAQRRGIPVRRADGEPAVQLGTGRHRHIVDGSLTDLTTATGLAVAGDPVRLRRAFDRFEVPVPEGERADSIDEALDVAEELDFPLVLKASDDTGACITSRRIDDRSALRDAYHDLRATRAPAVIERFVEGGDYRLLFVDGRLATATERLDDGDRDVDVATVHPETTTLLGFAADSIGLAVAAFDVRTTDLATPLRGNDGKVVGLNARPTLRSREREAAAIVDALFPGASRGRVPIVAVTGTNGKTTTSRLVAHLLGVRGATVGFTSTDGVYVDGELLFEGDMTGPMAADLVLSNPRVDAAVLETARGGILRAGVGFDQCDVGVVLNVSADHLGIGGIHTVEQLARVKAVIPSLVRPEGYAVLSADDARVLAMRDGTKAQVALFTAGAPEPGGQVARHAAAGGMAAAVEDAQFVLYRGGQREVVLPVADAPLTVGGAAQFQIANATAAMLAAACAGVEIEALREGLRSFRSTAAATPGRMNALRINGGTVIVDYAHNQAALKAVFDFVARMPAAHRLASVGAPGDRLDDDIRALGALAASVDFAVFRENEHYRRGRAPGVITSLLAEGFVQAGGSPERMATARDEPAAIAEVLRRMQPDDLVLMTAADPAGAIEALRRAGAVDA